MCPPDFYGIEYEINPWMSRQKQSDPRRRPTRSGTACARLLEAAAAQDRC